MNLKNIPICPTGLSDARSDNPAAVRPPQANPLKNATSPHENLNALPHRQLGRIILAAGAILSHFKSLMRGWPRTHRYRHSFGCGGEACVKFKQFRRAALMSVSWKRPCRCADEEQKRRCERELGGWLDEAEAFEVAAKHFRFRHEGSLTFDLGEAGTIIY